MRPKGPTFHYITQEKTLEPAVRRFFKAKGSVSIATALIENAAMPSAKQRTQAEIAQELGVGIESIRQVASRLRKRGRLKGSDRQTTNAASPAAGPHPPVTGGPVSAPELEEALRKAALGDFSGIDVLDADKRRRGLSYLAQTAPPAVQVQAHKALEDMERAQGTVVGPPPPQSDAEVTSRLAALLDAAGPTLAFAAMKQAFPKVAT